MSQGNNIRWLIVSVIVIAFGFMLNDPYLAHLFALLCVYSILAVSFRFIMLCGEINLAHASFFGIGAYTSAALTIHFNVPFIVAFFVSGIIAAIVSILFGAIAFRVKGHFFLLLSFAFAEVIRLFFQNAWTDVLGGVTGIAGITSPMGEFYGFIAIVTLLILYTMYFLEKSKLGKILIAIRNSEDLSRSIGISSMKYKVLSLVVASLLVGMSGSMFAHFNFVISPEDFTFHLSIIILSFVIIGGRDHFIGPVIGVVLLVLVAEYLRGFGSYEILAYGLAIILAMLFMPKGIAGTLQSLRLIKLKSSKSKSREEAKV